MISLGIDPGSHRCGMAILGEGKCIYDTFQPKGDSSSRLYALYTNARAMAEKYKPSVVVVERVFFGMNRSSAMMTAEARGALIAGVAAGMIGHAWSLLEPTPTQIKKAVTGDGRADKKDIKKYLEAILKRPLSGLPDGIDALGMSWMGLRR